MKGNALLSKAAPRTTFPSTVVALRRKRAFDFLFRIKKWKSERLQQ